MLDFGEALCGQAHFGQGLAVHFHLGGENGHGFTVTTIGVGAGDLALLYAELLGQGFLQTGAIQGGQGGELLRLQAGTDEGGESGYIGRVENNHHELNVRAVLLNILAEFCGNLAVALEEVLTGHAFLAGCSTGGNDVLGILEGFGWINGGGEVHIRECAVVHLGQNALEARLEDIVQADVGGETQHAGGLNHVGTDHSGSAHNKELFISKEFHNYLC